MSGSGGATGRQEAAAAPASADERLAAGGHAITFGQETPADSNGQGSEDSDNKGGKETKGNKGDGNEGKGDEGDD
jgi:hypothetical protein